MNSHVEPEHRPTHAYTIRRAGPNDLPLLPAIESAAGRLFIELPDPPAGTSGVMSLTALAHWLREGAIWVAVEAGGAPVGFAVAREVDGAGYLHEIDVHPEHGGRGLGRLLIAAVCAWARARGWGWLWLSTFRDVAWNAPFYARLGFHEVSDEAVGPGLRAIRAEEIVAGLAPEHRVFMALELAGGDD
ncbi:MAG TPA: GNAT family N-acetyltransferase [Anaerolineales bacterium]|nr:GNAT family N-acetyltransferase [Anaerolineales bacterium]HRF47625.1 GNAT family N-acetyltransferase [Anaerolineales bacterium]